jgi:Sortase domain
MSQRAQRGSRGRLIGAAIAVLLVGVGTSAILIGIRAQKSAPQPPASAAIPYSTAAAGNATKPTPAGSGSSTPATPRVGAPATPTTVGLILPPSSPVSLSVPSIGVSNSSLVTLGLNPDHTVQTPSLGANSQAGWYKNSPTPGSLGPALLLGHVDTAEYGPGIFFKLGALKPGAQVSVTRADHMVAVFRVDRVVSYAKDTFPSLAVYGNTDNAQLRLITCGGKFDFSTHNYLSNIVAYASLISSHKA